MSGVVVIGIHMRTGREYSDGMAAPATLLTVPTIDKAPRPRRWVPLSLRVFVAILLVEIPFGFAFYDFRSSPR